MQESPDTGGRASGSRARFEVVAAFALGLLLPVLETIRRGFGFWAIDATTMLEDYLAGGLLLLAGWAAVRGKTFSPTLLLAAWSGVATMMTLSLIGQVEDTVRAVDLEPNNTLVLIFKLVLWLTCSTSFVKSFRAVDQKALSSSPPQ